LLGIEGQSASPTDRLIAYAAQFEQTFANNRRLCICAMLGAEFDTLPKVVVTEVERFFKVNLDWLTPVFESGQRAALITSKQPAEALAETFLCVLEGSMVVCRGKRSASGPNALGHTFLSTLLT
jgi:TetR/AcrR family transcriptional repressor of nem operon